MIKPHAPKSHRSDIRGYLFSNRKRLDWDSDAVCAAEALHQNKQLVRIV
jgi:hypothetical protein